MSYIRDNEGSDIFRAFFFFTQGQKTVSIRLGFYFSTVFLPLHKLLSQERYPHPSEKSWLERIHLLTPPHLSLEEKAMQSEAGDNDQTGKCVLEVS